MIVGQALASFPARAVRVSLSLLAMVALAAPVAAQHSYQAPGATFDPRVPKPAQSLGYEVGEKFTPHHRIVRYIEQLAATSPRVRVDTLGVTAEGREVVMAIISAERNIARLDAIKADAARLADPRGADAGTLAQVVARQPAIVWLGYTVHGNEASGTEASLAMLYQLAAGQDAETRAILDSTVVLIDPVQNADGHERHVQDQRRALGVFGPPVTPGAMVHQGNWPGARGSHYYFDLNRDWFIQSHPESRARAGAILSWWPQVAVDLHEMGSNSTYFFAPPMEPVNKNIPPNTIKWWDIFASGIGGSFDERGWPYFRREGYDEFYPGYGVSWPILNGAIGATFEQASSGGGAIRRSDGTIMTLLEAARHHYTAAWATTLTAAHRRTELVGDYVRSRQQNVTDLAKGPMRSVVIERDAQGRADSLVARLLDNGIEVSRLGAATTVGDARAYGAAANSSLRVEAGWYAVDLAQPQGRLAKALLEPDAQLDSSFIKGEIESRVTGASSRFYDMTGWSLPFAFRVRAWTSGQAVGGERTRVTAASLKSSVTAPAVGAHGWAFEVGSEASYRMLAGLFRDSVRVWYAPKAFTSGGVSFPRGAFVVRVAGNRADVAKSVNARALESGAVVRTVASALVEQGTDLGSNSVRYIEAPRVALLGGQGVNGLSFGFAWYAFDNRLGYPVTSVTTEWLAGAGLDEMDVLVMPSVQGAAFERALGDAGKERLQRWVRGGGVIVTLGASTSWLASERSGLSRFRTRRDSTGGEFAPLATDVPGAIARATGDTLSPLMAGVHSSEIPVMVDGATIFVAPKELRPGEAVMRFAPKDRVRLSGYFWPEVAERIGNSPYLFTERVGQGRVIGFAGDPNFRDLWRGLLPLFANAVFFGGSY
ncbi:MAG TPA: M14 metallopeptidase family protein [Gemmatimonadaceae bacterium]|nr:M14 metallopeptidase family protein [Gemmatimonadaceae bacterium]